MPAATLTLRAFVLINLAALLHGLAPLLAPAGYQTWPTAGGLWWMLAFGLFLWVHAPCYGARDPMADWVEAMNTKRRGGRSVRE